MTPVVALIGGGVSVAALVELLPRALTIDALDIRLAAQDLATLEVIAGRCRALVSDRPGWTVTASSTAVDAARGADVIVLMIRVGGLAARRADEDLSRQFGIPGDEGLGPGGAANALRTLPVLGDLADDLRRVAPGATVLNLVSPLGLTTRLLLDRGLDTIGVCELPGVTEASLRAELGVDLAYAGLNHLGWFWPRVDAAAGPDAVLAAAADAGLADASVLAAFGAIPLKYYYWLFDPAAAARLGISRDPDRTAGLIDLRDQALAEFAAAPGAASPSLDARPTPWFSEGLVPMLAAILLGHRWRGFANVRNGDLVPGLERDLVIETRATLDGHELHAEPLADRMPSAAWAFVESVARAEDLTYRSWRDVDELLLVDAFVDGPHHFDRPSARRLAQTMRFGAQNPVGAPG